jgi:hypothetical protein
MSEKQFDIFDDPFREAASQYEPEFNEAAWKKMEAKLDGDPNNRKPFGWLWWFSDIIMIALVVIVLFQLNPGKSNKNAPSMVQTSKKEDAILKRNDEPAIVKEEEDLTSATTTIPQQIENSKADLSTTKQNSLRVNDNRSVNYVGSSHLNNEGKEPKNRGALEDGEGQGSITTKAHEKTSNKDKSAQVKDGAAVISLSATLPEKDPSIQSSGENATNARVEDSTKNQVSLSEKTDSSITQASQNQAAPPGIVKPKIRPFKGIYIQALAGPEWSFITGNKLGPITSAYGAAAGYAFGNRLSVQAGIFSTKKLYEAGPGDYDYYNLKITHVEADCRVLEIPLTVNYLLLSKGKNQLIVTAGFASLIMKKEVYHINFENPWGAPDYKKKTYQTNEFNPFASMFLGAGYSYSITKNLSLNAGPYLKIPLYGVGEGKVKISSTGILFGLQYGFSTRRNNKKTNSVPVQK